MGTLLPSVTVTHSVYPEAFAAGSTLWRGSVCFWARKRAPCPFQTIIFKLMKGKQMNKTELIEAAAASTGMSKSDIQTALDAILEAIANEVSRGNKVTLTGFGNFELRERAARTGRNPQTGEQIQVAASRTPAFKAGKSFKEAVNR
jgi:DNA-binding protein HU-beta